MSGHCGQAAFHHELSGESDINGAHLTRAASTIEKVLRLKTSKYFPEAYVPSAHNLHEHEMSAGEQSYSCPNAVPSEVDGFDPFSVLVWIDYTYREDVKN